MVFNEEVVRPEEGVGRAGGSRALEGIMLKYEAQKLYGVLHRRNV